MDKKRLVFISRMAAPYRIKFCDALQDYYEAEFWFHVHIGSNRPSWWRIDLGDNCKIFDRVIGRNSFRPLSLDVVSKLRDFQPDIVVLGGFTQPSGFIAYNWAKLQAKKTIAFTELSRSRAGKVREKGPYTRLIRWLYRDIDGVFASAHVAVPQLRDAFQFGEKVRLSQYAADIDQHLNHPLRETKNAYVYLFANRLISLYNPLLAIDIFDSVQKRYPASKLLMNGSGALRNQCDQEIVSRGLSDKVTFLDNIESWDQLHEVYQACDILLFPARFSAANFTILEAMASGMGLVISDRIMEAKMEGIIGVSDGVNGFVRPPSRVDFIEAIELYHRIPGLLCRHGEQNKLIAARSSPSATARQWYELIESL